ncbi:MAG: DUF4423 domain-containing protein [Candidatus Bathyarchaeota archaeon]|nr:DUF4423 domain-containing protein [Candidatus Bathyarchaeota archaeon]
MPCVSADGKPTTTGMQTLKALKDAALTPEEVATKTNQPLFRVRSGLRQLQNAEFTKQTSDGKYALTEKGTQTIQ